VALYGLGLVLGLAVLWPLLERLLARNRVYLVVGVFGSRAVGIYLWHIPLVAAAAGLAWWAGFAAPPLSPAWWGVHLVAFALVVTGAWFVAGVAGRADRALSAWGRSRRRRTLPVLPFAIAVPVALLSISPTGFGTWWGAGMLGIPSSSAVNLAVLAVAWWALAVGRDGVTEPARDLPDGRAYGQATS